MCRGCLESRSLYSDILLQVDGNDCDRLLRTASELLVILGTLQVLANRKIANIPTVERGKKPAHFAHLVAVIVPKAASTKSHDQINAIKNTVPSSYYIWHNDHQRIS